MAGIPVEKLVECHGHFRTASCIRCKKAASIEIVRECIVVQQQPPLCSHCKVSSSSKNNPAYVKPDIVFFGEKLPDIFHSTLPDDLEKADLCLILGTSLQVPPTAHIPDMVAKSCKRVLLNRELVGNLRPSSARDAFHAGDCDESVLWIARLLGWEEELLEKHEQTRIRAKIALKQDTKKKQANS